MSRAYDEAKKYKDLPTEKLKKVIRKYKSLSTSNSDIYNFLFTFVIMIISSLFFLKLSILTLLLLVHYLFFWEFLHKYKKVKLVSDKDKEEIDEVIEILERYLKEKETKYPSE